MKLSFEELKAWFNDQTVVTLVSFVSALLSVRNNAGMPHIPLFLTTASGFCVACLSGFIMLEHGWMPWLSSGMAYLMGQVGNHLVNAVLVAIKKLEVDPYSTAGKIIELIWSWKLPFKNNDQKPV